MDQVMEFEKLRKAAVKNAPKLPSELGLALETGLRLASHRYGHELLPAEVADWSQRFQGEAPAMLEYAFREFDATGKFFPKPSEISELIRIKRQSADPEPPARCARCKDYCGFIYVTVPGEKYQRVKRCDHRPEQSHEPVESGSVLPPQNTGTEGVVGVEKSAEQSRPETSQASSGA